MIIIIIIIMLAILSIENWSRKSDFGATNATVVKASISRVRRSEKASLPMSKEMEVFTNGASPNSWMGFVMEHPI